MGFMEWFGRKNKLSVENNALQQKTLTAEEVKNNWLSAESLKTFDWEEFGLRLIQANILSASYSPIPRFLSDNREPYASIDGGKPAMTFYFDSKTDEKSKQFIVVGSRVMVSDELNVYIDSEPASKIWQEMSNLKPEKEIKSVFDNTPVM